MTVSYSRIGRRQSNIGEKTSKYYALPVQTGNVGTRQLAGEVTQSSSPHRKRCVRDPYRTLETDRALSAQGLFGTPRCFWHLQLAGLQTRFQ